ncbi:MAG TPA: hypothetical protein VEZ48_07600 [Sphingomonadaceae bacterium]|nr:hypothetical protein [Sphingomonadaceae bacterium]
MTDLFVEAVGWIGALLILAGYALLTSGRVTAQSPLYQWLNVVGAAGFIVNGVANEAYPSAGLNIVWMGIGAVALWNIARRRGQAPV